MNKFFLIAVLLGSTHAFSRANQFEIGFAM